MCRSTGEVSLIEELRDGMGIALNECSLFLFVILPAESAEYGWLIQTIRESPSV